MASVAYIREGMAVRDGLWNGADVRWVGPDSDRDGVPLRRGDRAVVVEAGRHHVGSFGSLTAPSDRDVRPGRGVVVRLVDGQEVRVPVKHIELVAPHHPLRPEPDVRLADWWLKQLEAWDHALPVASFVPRAFPAVCRILHPWADRQDRPVAWQQVVERSDATSRAELGRRIAESRVGSKQLVSMIGVEEPRDGELGHPTAQALVDLLRTATQTPDDVLFAVWQGWGDIPPQRFPGTAQLDTPQRGHFLLRGPLEGALTSVSASHVGARPVSGIWWPTDRTWFVHTEIDFPWTFLAGTRKLIQDAVGRSDLEAIITTFDTRANVIENGPDEGAL